jgi:hypothetical protein
MARGSKMKAKSKKSMPKSLTGPFKQADTMADTKTMGNPRAVKARDKRLAKASV